MTVTTAADVTAKKDVKVARWVAMVAGLIGFVLSVLTPLVGFVSLWLSL